MKTSHVADELILAAINRMTRVIAVPFPPVSPHFVTEPLVSCFEHEIRFFAVVESAHIRLKIPEYVAPAPSY